MEKVVDAVVGLSALERPNFCFGTRVRVSSGANLTSDATNRKTVRLIVVVLWVDVGAVEVQVPGVGA